MLRSINYIFFLSISIILLYFQSIIFDFASRYISILDLDELDYIAINNAYSFGNTDLLTNSSLANFNTCFVRSLLREDPPPSPPDPDDYSNNKSVLLIADTDDTRIPPSEPDPPDPDPDVSNNKNEIISINSYHQNNPTYVEVIEPEDKDLEDMPPSPPDPDDPPSEPEPDELESKSDTKNYSLIFQLNEKWTLLEDNLICHKNQLNNSIFAAYHIKENRFPLNPSNLLSPIFNIRNYIYIQKSINVDNNGVLITAQVGMPPSSSSEVDEFDDIVEPSEEAIIDDYDKDDSSSNPDNSQPHAFPPSQVDEDDLK